MKAILEFAGLIRFIDIELADLKKEKRIAVREDMQFLMDDKEEDKTIIGFRQLSFRYRGRIKKCPCCETEFPVFEFEKMK
jgi:hypothetical protein